MQITVRLDSPLTLRWAKLFSRQSLLRAARMMGPTLVALTFAGVAHAQGTMDFSGAQTLMGSFKTFAIYAGAVICFFGLIFAGIRMISGRFQDRKLDISEAILFSLRGKRSVKQTSNCLVLPRWSLFMAILY